MREDQKGIEIRGVSWVYDGGDPFGLLRYARDVEWRNNRAWVKVA